MRLTFVYIFSASMLFYSLATSALDLESPPINKQFSDVSKGGIGEGEGEIVAPLRKIHSADYNSDTAIQLQELLRVIQFFNSGGLHCADNPGDSEDGYLPGVGINQDCLPHSSDFQVLNWQITLTELLRLIQFFNIGHYRVSPLTSSDDGFVPGKFPNVVFMLLDTLRANKLAAIRNGVPVMPFLSQFALQGSNFINAISPGSWTRPAIFTLFSGLYPEPFMGALGTNTHTTWYVLEDSIETMPEWFASYGYDNWTIFNNDNVSANFGFDQGFPFEHIQTLFGNPASIVNSRVLDDIDSWREPFFSYIHYVDPHSPFNPPQADIDIFGPLPSMTAFDTFNLNPNQISTYIRDIYTAWFTSSPPLSVPLTTNGKAGLRHLFDAESHSLDTQLGIMVNEILSRFPDTVFVFISDHGEDLENRYAVTHGHSLYQELIKVPFIMVGPGVPVQEVSRFVETGGILPALASVLELPQEPYWQLSNPLTSAPDVPIFSSNHFAPYGLQDIWGYSVIVNGKKLMHHSLLGGPKLYDLAADPAETNDLAATDPATVATLEAILQAHFDAIGF